MWLINLLTYRRRKRKALAEAIRRAELSSLEYWYTRTYIWPEDDERRKNQPQDKD